MQQNVILERIRKLLAMAGDTVSPNEAAIAAKRARYLMDKHQISEWDLKSSKPEDFGSADQLHMGSWHGMLSVAMAWLNDVNVRQATEQGISLIRFEGYLVDAVTAKELWLYLVAQCEQQAKRVKGRKDPYRRGFAGGVQAQVLEILKEREQLKCSDGTSLVVSKRAMVTERFGAMQTSRNRQAKGGNYEKGFAAGKKAGLSRQVGHKGNSGYLT